MNRWMQSLGQRVSFGASVVQTSNDVPSRHLRPFNRLLQLRNLTAKLFELVC